MRLIIRLAPAMALATLAFSGAAQAQQQYDPGGKAKVSIYCKTTVPGDTACPGTGGGGGSTTGFTPAATATANLATTTSSADVALPAGTDIVVTNTGSVDANFRIQVGAGTAATTDQAIKAGAAIGIHVGTATHLSAITAAGSTSLNIQGGAGLAAGYGGGGSVAGGATAANQTTEITALGAIPPQTYALLTNATSSGSTVTNVQGGSYLLDARGTFGGTSITVQVTNADGTFATFSTIAAAGTGGPFQIGAGSSVKAVVTGGSPSGLYVSLQGIGSGANPNVGPISYSTTDKGGTITTGGTAQAAIASNVARKAYCIQNDPAATEILSVRLNGTASATTGTILQAGQQACNVPGFIDTSAVSVFAATTGHRWFGYEGQ